MAILCNISEYLSSLGFGIEMMQEYLTYNQIIKDQAVSMWYHHTLDLKECRGTLSSGKSTPRFSSNISSEFLIST